MALGLRLASKPLSAQAPTAAVDGANWPGSLQGRHRQMADVYAVNAGFPLAFAYTLIVPNKSAVVVLRHGVFPIALGNAIWEKYKIGASFEIIDPETKFIDPESNAPATKNPAPQAWRTRGGRYGR